MAWGKKKKKKSKSSKSGGIAAKNTPTSGDQGHWENIQQSVNRL